MASVQAHHHAFAPSHASIQQQYHPDASSMGHFFQGPAAGFSTPFFPSSGDAFYLQQQQHLNPQKQHGYSQQASAFSRRAFDAALMSQGVHGYEQQYAPRPVQSQYHGSFGRSRVPSWEDSGNCNVGVGQQSEPFSSASSSLSDGSQQGRQPHVQQQQRPQQQRQQDPFWQAPADTRASLAAAAAAALDHPSFMRPPHRVNHEVKSATPTRTIPIAAASHDQPVIYDLIPNVSPVPPPPSIERSAVPLADLAVEMIWEAIQLGLAADSTAHPPSFAARFPSLFAAVSANAATTASACPSPRETQELGIASHGRRTSRSSPHTPELYGAIGDRRGNSIARKVSHMSFDDGFTSDESSPANTAPGTPADDIVQEDPVARRQRLAGLGLGLGYPVTAIDDKEDLVAPRKFKQQAGQATQYAHSFPAEPTTAFRQFVKQVLTATLLAPEDLVLALYYVARMPSTSVIPPMTQEQAGPGVDTKASALKAAPFKIMLGALTLANKTLQDNSYRNETFAAVSGIPLRDVNDLEIFVFAALGFDVAVTEEVWRPWLDIVVGRSRQRQRAINAGNVSDVHSTLSRLVRAAAVANSSPVSAAVSAPSSPLRKLAASSSPVSASIALSPPHSAPASSTAAAAGSIGPAPALRQVPACPKTPITNASASALADINLDASGPLESPLRFDRHARFRTNAAPSPTRARPLLAAKRFGSSGSGNSAAGGSAARTCAMMAAQQALFAPSSTYLRSFGIENRIR